GEAGNYATEALVGGTSRRYARWQGADKMRALLKVSEGLRRPLEWIALTSGWLMVIMACVTSFDVVARKFGMQLPYTRLQELEWHFHATIFSMWMGYCYTINAHPRVDSFTERITYSGKPWVETAFSRLPPLPYMALVSYYSIDFVEASYRIGEQSDSTVGLTHRWVIKGIYATGLWMVVAGILS